MDAEPYANRHRTYPFRHGRTRTHRRRRTQSPDGRATGPDGVDRDYYLRQLKGWKFLVPIELMKPVGLTLYARLCGWTLARAHARSGDRKRG